MDRVGTRASLWGAIRSRGDCTTAMSRVAKLDIGNAFCSSPRPVDTHRQHQHSPGMSALPQLSFTLCHVRSLVMLPLLEHTMKQDHQTPYEDLVVTGAVGLEVCLMASAYVIDGLTV